MSASRVFRKLALLAALAAPMLAHAGPRYSVTVVGGAGSFAADLNILGQVVGSYEASEGVSHAFLHTGTTFMDLGTLGGASSAAWRINDSGQVAGTADSASSQHGFFYSGGTMNPIPSWGNFSNAAGINNDGTVVGWALSETEDGFGARRAYTYKDGVMTDLGTLPIGDSSRAIAINNAGHVVGAAANVIDGFPNRPETSFLYRDGVMTDIGNFGGIWSAATSINDHNQIVGFSGLEGMEGADFYPSRAFLFTDGVLQNLGTLIEHESSFAYDINNLGQVVGAAGTFSGSRGFLYEYGAMVDLNTLIDPASGWMVQEAWGINDVQQIAGRACKGDQCFAVRLDLVQAIPEPATYGMLLAGFALIGVVRRRTRFSA